MKWFWIRRDQHGIVVDVCMESDGIGNRLITMSDLIEMAKYGPIDRVQAEHVIINKPLWWEEPNGGRMGTTGGKP